MRVYQYHASRLRCRKSKEEGSPAQSSMNAEESRQSLNFSNANCTDQATQKILQCQRAVQPGQQLHQ